MSVSNSINQNILTELDLQLWLAKQLPEEINADHAKSAFIWRDTAQPVTSREWDYIVRRVEEKLTTVCQQNKYQADIAEACWSDESRADNQVVFNQLTAPWPTRTITLMKVKGETE